MTDNRGRTKPPSQTQGRQRLNFFIGFIILAGLMLFLFWPVVKSLVSLVTG
jgi:hypothetical protein